MARYVQTLTRRAVLHRIVGAGVVGFAGAKIGTVEAQASSRYAHGRAAGRMVRLRDEAGNRWYPGGQI